MFNYDVFRDLCYKRGESESSVAVACGVTRSAVTGWRRGATPSDPVIRKLAEYFCVDPAVFEQEDNTETVIREFIEEMRTRQTLTEDEQLLIDIFRLLPDERKQELLMTALRSKMK